MTETHYDTAGEPMPPSWNDVVTSIAAKARAEGTVLPLLFPLIDSLDAELLRRSNAANVATKWPPTYEPSLVEPLLGDIGSLLNRCTAHARELSELEIAWVTQFLDSGLRREMAEIDRQSQSLALQTLPTDTQAKSQAAASLLFDAASAADPLAAAMAAQADGASKASAEIALSATERALLVDKRYSLMIEHYDALDARYAAVGSAHNFLERYRRVAELLGQDWDEAYEKAFVASLGLKYIFEQTGTWADPPTLGISGEGPLFEFVLWTRRAVREVERLSEREHEWELVLPLVQPMFQGGTSLVTTAAFAGAIALAANGQNATLAFIIPSELATYHQRARIVALGASLVVKSASELLLSYRLRASLVPPRHPLPSFVVDYDDQEQPLQWRRSAIVCGNVRPFVASATVDMVQSLATHNIRLLETDGWHVIIHPFVNGATPDAVPLKSSDILDVRIHMKVVSEVSYDGIVEAETI